MVCLFCIVLHVIRGTLTLTNTVWMKSFTHMSCQSIGLLGKISSIKTMPPYLQYCKELFTSWSCHNTLTGHPDPSLINHFLDILGRWVHDLYPFPAATLPELECQLAEKWQRNQQGRGIQFDFDLLNLIYC